MYEVDLIGIDKVINHIKLTGLTKFSINRVGSTSGSAPVFELINCNSNEKACSIFSNWAENMNAGIPYKLTLFDKIETSVDEFGNEKKTKSKSKTENSTIYFKLHTSSTPYEQHNTHGINGSVDRDAVRREVLKELEEKSLKDQIKALSEKVDQVLNGEEEEEEESSLTGMQSMTNLVTLLQGLGLMNNNKPTAINGVENSPNDAIKNNINKAIKVLYKNDPKLDQDLLKLADLSEKQPATFSMLLNTLRNM